MAYGVDHSLISFHRLSSLMTLSGLFLLFTVPLLAQQAPATAPPGRQAVVAVKGMACSACAHRLQKVLSKMPGVEKAEVRLEKEQAILLLAAEAKISDKQIEETVRNAGFVPGAIEWRPEGEKKAAPAKSQ